MVHHRTLSTPTFSRNDDKHLEHYRVHLPTMELEQKSIDSATSSLFKATPLGFAQLLVKLFYRPGQRESPSEFKTLHARLITIASSHFGEKARWSMDIIEKECMSSWYYTEDVHSPPFITFQNTLASSTRKYAESVAPVVLLPDGSCINHSDNIMRKLCPFLYPSLIVKEVMMLEDELATRLGATLRCHAFGHLFLGDNYNKANAIENKIDKQYYPGIIYLSTLGVPFIEKILFRILLKTGHVDQVMKTVLKITPERVKASELELIAVFDEMSKRLEKASATTTTTSSMSSVQQENNNNTCATDGYLMDMPQQHFGFTAADLTFAALAYPYIRPDCMQDFLPPLALLPPRVVELCVKLRKTRAGQHVLHIYEHHRPVDKVTGKVVLKSKPEIGKIRYAKWYLLGIVGITSAYLYFTREKGDKNDIIISDRYVTTTTTATTTIPRSAYKY